MKNLNKLISILFIGICTQTFSQVFDKKGDSRDKTSEALTKNKYGPKIYLGSISENTSVNSFVVNTVEKKFTMQGIIWDNLDSDNDKNNGFVSAVKVEAENENDVISVFGSRNINSKFTGDLSIGYRLRPWAVNYFKKENKIDNFETYSFDQFMTVDSIRSRMRFAFVTIGVNISGAKYYLIDSTTQYDDMVTKKNFNGWQFYGNINLLNYNPKSKRASLHTVKLTYGEVNNIDDLTEYKVGFSNAYTSGVNSTKFSREITGYYDSYFVQHRAILSYEYNLFSMDTTKTRLGFVCGGDFVYNEQEKNYVKINAGFNFPIKYGQEPEKGKGDERKRIYIAAIISSTDPFDIRKTSDFNFRNTLSVSLKLATSLNIKFRK